MGGGGAATLAAGAGGAVEAGQGYVAGVLGAKDYYSVLGLSRKEIDKATPPAVFTAAYKRRALLVHPDKCSEAGAEDAFARVRQAMMVLADPRLREAYNERLAGQRRGVVGLGAAAEREMETQLQRQRNF
eukprot:1109453-Prymnesium_polylepis.1